VEFFSTLFLNKLNSFLHTAVDFCTIAESCPHLPEHHRLHFFKQYCSNFLYTQCQTYLYITVYFIYLIQQTKDPKVTNMSHSNESVLNTKKTVSYTNKQIIKDDRHKTTDSTCS